MPQLERVREERNQSSVLLARRNHRDSGLVDQTIRFAGIPSLVSDHIDCGVSSATGGCFTLLRFAVLAEAFSSLEPSVVRLAVHGQRLVF